MSQRISAIVENGLLRPMSPLALANGTRVDIELTTAKTSNASALQNPAEILDRIASLPEESPEPATNVSQDHDQFLYGSRATS